MYSPVSFFLQLRLIYIIFGDITLIFRLGSKIKNNFRDIFQNAISSHQVIVNSVRYGKYPTLNMVLLLHLIW